MNWFARHRRSRSDYALGISIQSRSECEMSDQPPFEGNPLVVTKGGKPFEDQAEGLRQFKEACLASKTEQFSKPYFPGTASMFAFERQLAVTNEWMRGWNACLDEIDRNGGFTRKPK